MTQEVMRAIENRLKPDTCQVLFVCGLGGSGKSVFCDSLQATLGRDSVVLRTDWYLTLSSSERKERIQRAFETSDEEVIEKEGNPINSYDWDAFKRDLAILKETGKLQLPGVWNQTTGEKDDVIELEASEDAIIICDGIYMLDPSIRDEADLIVLLEISSEEAKKRSDGRDKHRNSDRYLAYKDALTWKYDLPYFRKYTNKADLIIDNSDFDSPRVVKS